MKDVVRSTLAVAAAVVLLWPAAAAAMTTPQQRCDYARVTAWKKYLACMDTIVAKVAKGVPFEDLGAFARCRHAYFQQWTHFQTKASLSGSTCIGMRFVDNSDQTVTDKLTTLVWEKKDNLDDTPNYADVRDADNDYSLSTEPYPYKENGTAFTSFLATLNAGSGFAGVNGWRMPALVELESIVVDFPCRGLGGSPTCTCGDGPCVDATLGPTAAAGYLSVTRTLDTDLTAWAVYFRDDGGGQAYPMSASSRVRAVRGGL